MNCSTHIMWNGKVIEKKPAEAGFFLSCFASRSHLLHFFSVRAGDGEGWRSCSRAVMKSCSLAVVQSKLKRVII